jgi:hypothetical protein
MTQCTKKRVPTLTREQGKAQIAWVLPWSVRRRQQRVEHGCMSRGAARGSFHQSSAVRLRARGMAAGPQGSWAFPCGAGGCGLDDRNDSRKERVS